MDAESKMDDLKGRAKEAVGDLTDNPSLQHEGKADQFAGKVKEKLSDAKEWIDDKVDAIKDKTH
jgi:uncharacterized protein YjbJ (UPF0337 family)